MDQLRNLSLEQIGNIEITSVSKRPEPLSAAAASVYVITADDIRRSGAQSLAEALRLAPNLEVARINAFSYAITARGFNSPESANKLLVLIDGRSVYSPIGSTVFWQGVDVPVDTIERIEVISGPGGSLYGANAVNGVINVITKPSAGTQGLFASAVGGTSNDSVFARYGGALDNWGSYRAYVSDFHRDGTDPVLATDTTRDSFDGIQGGFRFDGSFGREDVSWHGNIFANRVAGAFEKLWGGNLTANWTHTFDGGSQLGVIAYWDRSDRDTFSLRDRLNTYDLQIQHTIDAGTRNHIVWGGEYRVWRETFVSFDTFFFRKPKDTISVANAFVQDQVALGDGLTLTAGIKAEDNSLSGLDLMPNLRLAWQAAPHTLFWAGVSHAVRTPSRIDQELISPGLLIASPHFKSEKLIDYEAGYRGTLFDGFDLSATVFYDAYDDLRSDEFTPVSIVPIQLQNHLNARTYGVEAWADWSPFSWWRLYAGYNSLHKDLGLDPGTNDLSFFQAAGQDPPYQLQFRSQMNVLPDLELDLDVRHVAHVERPFAGATLVLVPAYTEADARIGWHIRDNLELSVAGFNLLHPRHIEANDPSSYPERYIPRSVLVELRASL